MSRCFVVGTGPSLLKTNLDTIADEYSYSANAVHKIYPWTDWRPNVLVIGDVTADHRAWVHEGCPKPDPRYQRFQECVVENPQASIMVRADYRKWAEEMCPGRLEYFDICTHHNLGYPYDWNKAPATWHPPQFCRWGGGIGMAIQMAVRKGFGTIYVLGCDLGYHPGVGNHFAPDYGDPLKPYQASALNAVLNWAHWIARDEAAKHGIRILNAAPEAGPAAYDRVSLEDVL